MNNTGYILLVDDSEANNLLNKRLIKKFLPNCTGIYTVFNGKQALDYLKGDSQYTDRTEYPFPQIIFLDINMPVMNGFEFLEEYNQIKDDLMCGESKIYMLTSSIVDSDKNKAEELGVDGFITKPLTKDLLEQFTVHS